MLLAEAFIHMVSEKHHLNSDVNASLLSQAAFEISIDLARLSLSLIDVYITMLYL